MMPPSTSPIRISTTDAGSLDPSHGTRCSNTLAGMVRAAAAM